MRDMLGQEVQLGDKVAYPASVGRSMQKEMVVGRFMGQRLKPRIESSYNFETRQREYKAVERAITYIKPEHRSRSKNFSNQIVVIELSQNIVKIGE